MQHWSWARGKNKVSLVTATNLGVYHRLSIQVHALHEAHPTKLTSHPTAVQFIRAGKASSKISAIIVPITTPSSGNAQAVARTEKLACISARVIWQKEMDRHPGDLFWFIQRIRLSKLTALIQWLIAVVGAIEIAIASPWHWDASLAVGTRKVPRWANPGRSGRRWVCWTWEQKINGRKREGETCHYRAFPCMSISFQRIGESKWQVSQILCQGLGSRGRLIWWEICMT